MKARIFLYLFIFAFLYSIFQFVNTKRYSEAKEKEIAELEEHLHSVEADLESYKVISEEGKGDGFTLQSNTNAKEFFEDQDIDVDSLATEIERQLIAKNKPRQDNPLIPYAAEHGRAMHINRIKILNNRWIIAEFTDGVFWGEALISYYLDENNQLQFDTKDGVLYNH